jgi:SET domain-containing protein
MTDILRFQIPQTIPSHVVEIRESPGKGRGVFATQTIAAGTCIESAPVIAFSEEQWKIIAPSLLYDYVFEWGGECNGGAIALGYGSLYNHDYHPNAYYVRREADGFLDFIARRDISVGEEISVNYNGMPDCQDPVWFAK